MDCEGDEMNILPSINFEKVKLLAIEWNSVPNNKLHFEKYLEGFRVIYTSAENLLYAR